MLKKSQQSVVPEKPQLEVKPTFTRPMGHEQEDQDNALDSQDVDATRQKSSDDLQEPGRIKKWVRFQ